MKTKANFFIVGAAKSGTTSFVNYLSQHPDVFVPTIKEPKFFSVQDNIFPHKGPGDKEVDEKVVKEISAYRRLFERGSDCKAIGEASVDYLYFPQVARRIKEYNPEARIIILLREPTERAFSAYLHMVRDGRENLSFEEALEAEGHRKAMNWEFFWYYRELGFYSNQVARYFECFPTKQILVLLFEQFKTDPRSCIKQAYAFLGVNEKFEPDTSNIYNISGVPRSKWVHALLNRPNPVKSLVKPLVPWQLRDKIRRKVTTSNLVKIEMNPDTRLRLASSYRSDLVKLQGIINKDLTSWIQ